MKKLRVVVIGAGLGGCVVADALAAAGHDVTVVVHGDGVGGPADIGRPAITEPHVGLGLGGTTRWWHNGLRLPEAEVWETWPLEKEDLAEELAWAGALLGMTDDEAAVTQLRSAWHGLVGDGVRLERPLYYPNQRRNLWALLKLDGRVTVVRGEAMPLAAGKVVTAVQVMVAGEQVAVPCDRVVLCAGGLGTPQLLANLRNDWVGRGYEDHPTGLVAEVELNVAGVQKLWNVRVRGGALRQPLVVDTPMGPMAWYVRPAPPVGYVQRRARLGTLLSDLRNYPLRLGNYVRLLGSMGDLMEVLSLKLGLNVPTKRFGLWLVGGCPPSRHVAVGRDAAGQWWRDWRLPDGYAAAVRASLGQVVTALDDQVVWVQEVDGWYAGLQSSSHHSGTCCMSADAASGVVNAHGKVWSMANVWVADGSVIPASGTANTGWLIAALAKRTAKQVGEN